MQVEIKRRDGQPHMVELGSNLTVMEAIKAAGLDELEAACGGCCSCATCHIYIDEDHFALLPPMSEDEDALLESSSHRRSTSRLSCQLTLNPEVTPFKATIAPAD